MAADETQTQEMETSEEHVDRIVRNHVIGSMGVGLIPVPLVDLIGLTGIQLNMLRMLAKTYNIPFFKGMGKNIIGSLIGGGIPFTVGDILASLVKTVPVVGQTVGALTMPVVSGATTYAVGKVFVQHFASGGTFLSFDPEQVREYYAEMFRQVPDFRQGLICCSLNVLIITAFMSDIKEVDKGL